MATSQIPNKNVSIAFHVIADNTTDKSLKIKKEKNLKAALN
jgi:hypothetical protein